MTAAIDLVTFGRTERWYDYDIHLGEPEFEARIIVSRPGSSLGAIVSAERGPRLVLPAFRQFTRPTAGAVDAFMAEKHGIPSRQDYLCQTDTLGYQPTADDGTHIEYFQAKLSSQTRFTLQNGTWLPLVNVEWNMVKVDEHDRRMLRALFPMDNKYLQ